MLLQISSWTLLQLLWLSEACHLHALSFQIHTKLLFFGFTDHFYKNCQINLEFSFFSLLFWSFLFFDPFLFPIAIWIAQFASEIILNTFLLSFVIEISIFVVKSSKLNCWQRPWRMNRHLWASKRENSVCQKLPIPFLNVGHSL